MQWWIGSQWEIFGAGVSLVLLSIFLFSVNGILALFKVKTKIPSAIPWTVFILGIAIILHAFGLWLALYKVFAFSIVSINIMESIVGISLMIIAIYLKSDIVNNKIRIAFIFIGLMLFLDGTKALPIISYLVEFVDTLAYFIGSFAVRNPLIAVGIVIGVIIISVLIGVFVAKIKQKFGGVKGGVKT